MGSDRERMRLDSVRNPWEYSEDDFVDEPGEREGPTLEDLYTQLDGAIEAVTSLGVTAIALLPIEEQKLAEYALRSLLVLKACVNPGPVEEGPF